jgi:hypothetical protein
MGFRLTKEGRQQVGAMMLVSGALLGVVGVAAAVSWLIQNYPMVGVPLMTLGGFGLAWQGLRWVLEDE